MVATKEHYSWLQKRKNHSGGNGRSQIWAATTTVRNAHIIQTYFTKPFAVDRNVFRGVRGSERWRCSFHSHICSWDKRNILFLMLARRRWRLLRESCGEICFFFLSFRYSPFYRLSHWRGNSIVNEMALLPTSMVERDEPLFSSLFFFYSIMSHQL